MSLASVLSAVREIMLDELPLPESAEARLQFFEQRFPGLSPEEREDLSKIRPEGFRTYTGTIFSGERSVLRNLFPITFAELARAYAQHFGEPLDTFELAKDLHRKHPWKGNATVGLTTKFVEYLTIDRTDLKNLVPWLSDLSELEQLSVFISRSPDEACDSREGIHLTTLQSLSVGELLEISFAIPSAVVFKRFSWDVLTLRDYYYANDRALSSSLPRACTLPAIGARTRTLNVRWEVVPDALFSHLSLLPRASEFPLAKLAECYASGTSEQDEMRVFQEFFTQLIRLETIGAVVIKV